MVHKKLHTALQFKKTPSELSIDLPRWVSPRATSRMEIILRMSFKILPIRPNLDAHDWTNPKKGSTPITIYTRWPAYRRMHNKICWGIIFISWNMQWRSSDVTLLQGAPGYPLYQKFTRKNDQIHYQFNKLHKRQIDHYNYAIYCRNINDEA